MVEMFLRKIPEDMRPWECNVNGVKYVYPAGTEQNVPAEVAALIDAYWEKQEVDYPETGISFNDLRDRPFGESTEVLFDQRVEFELLEGLMGITVPFPEPLEPGKTYRVTYNDVAYDCVANIGPSGELCYLGNASIMGLDDTGEPFVVLVVEEMGQVFGQIASINSDTSATVKIEKSVIHTIDTKFLPGGGGGMLVTVTQNDDDTFTPDKTFQEAINAIAAGVDVRFVIQSEGSGGRTFPALIHAELGDEFGVAPEIWLYSNWTHEQYWWTDSRFVIHGGGE